MTLKAGGTTRRNRYIELHQNQYFCASKEAHQSERQQRIFGGSGLGLQRGEGKSHEDGKASAQ